MLVRCLQPSFVMEKLVLNGNATSRGPVRGNKIGMRAEQRCSGTHIMLPFARFVLFCFSFLFFEAVQVYKNTASISERSWLCLHCKAEGITGDEQLVPSWASCSHEGGVECSGGTLALLSPFHLCSPFLLFSSLQICKGGNQVQISGRLWEAEVERQHC